MKNKEQLLAKLGNMSILIVEDGEEILNLIEYTFKLLAKEIQIARNGLEGLEKLSIFKPSVIITDLRMPHLSGPKMIQKIRETDNQTPIIVITGYKEDLKTPELVNYIFEKPINFSNLLEVIDKVVVN